MKILVTGVLWERRLSPSGLRADDAVRVRLQSPGQASAGQRVKSRVQGAVETAGAVESLSGKKTVITGAASGIGAATARRFALEGAEVVLSDIDPAGEELADELGRENAAFVPCDVSDSGQVDELLRAAHARLKSVDVLFANAGIAVQKGTVEITEEDWSRMIDTDLKGVWLTCRAFLPGMVAAGAGSIIATASQLAFVGFAGLPAYGAAKGGVVNLIRCIAAEFGRDGIRANALCPGPTATAGLKRWLSDGHDGDDVVSALAESTLIGRLAKPEEIAAAALFLASDESSYVTGSALLVDGGYTTV